MSTAPAERTTTRPDENVTASARRTRWHAWTDRVDASLESFDRAMRSYGEELATALAEVTRDVLTGVNRGLERTLDWSNQRLNRRSGNDAH